MITLKNFSSRQLTSTEGFKRKIQKIATQLKIGKILYSQVIDIYESSIYVLLIDESMYFYELYLYSNEIIDILNSGFEALIYSLDFEDDDNILDKISKLEDDEEDTVQLLNDFKEFLSKSMEYLNIENSADLNLLDKVVSSDYRIYLTNLSYHEVYDVFFPIIKDLNIDMYKFKILSLDAFSAEFLIITNNCRLYQYKIFLKKDFSRFINRYISAILDAQSDILKKTFNITFRRSLKDRSFIKSLIYATSSPGSKSDRFDPISYLSFLADNFQIKDDSKSTKREGLKSIYKFFLNTSENAEEGKKNIVKHFMAAKTYIDKDLD